MVPQGNDELFNGVSHALGYLLGDALARAFAQRTVSRADVRALFHDPFLEPAVTFAALTRRLEAFGRRSHRAPARN
jgi:phage head maturation protease